MKVEEICHNASCRIQAICFLCFLFLVVFTIQGCGEPKDNEAPPDPKFQQKEKVKIILLDRIGLVESISTFGGELNYYVKYASNDDITTRRMAEYELEKISE